MIETTDSMESLGSTNYDFLFQALLLYAQMTVGEIHRGNTCAGFYHFHISCQKCLREIEPITLSTVQSYNHKPVSEILNSWKPEGTEWLSKRPMIDIREGNWIDKTSDEMSYHIGKTQGFLFGHLLSTRIGNPGSDQSLFPVALRRKLSALEYMIGLIDGLVMSSSITSLYKRSTQTLRRPTPLLLGQVVHLIDLISLHEGLINLWRDDKFLMEFIKIPHKIPSSYPLNNKDLGALGRNYLRSLFTNFKTLRNQKVRL